MYYAYRYAGNKVYHLPGNNDKSLCGSMTVNYAGFEVSAPSLDTLRTRADRHVSRQYDINSRTHLCKTCYKIATNGR